MTESKQKKRAEKKNKPTKAPKAQKATKTTEAAPRAAAKEKIVYVGNKPVKNYVIACLTSFSTGSDNIILKARGRAICKAVDTAELLRRAFLKNAQLQSITISTEQVTREGNQKSNVSAIEITVAKP